MPRHTTITTETTTHPVTVEATENNCFVITCPIPQEQLPSPPVSRRL